MSVSSPSASPAMRRNSSGGAPPLRRMSTQSRQQFLRDRDKTPEPMPPPPTLLNRNGASSSLVGVSPATRAALHHSASSGTVGQPASLAMQAFVAGLHSASLFPKAPHGERKGMLPDDSSFERGSIHALAKGSARASISSPSAIRAHETVTSPGRALTPPDGGARRLDLTLASAMAARGASAASPDGRPASVPATLHRTASASLDSLQGAHALQRRSVSQGGPRPAAAPPPGRAPPSLASRPTSVMSSGGSSFRTDHLGMRIDKKRRLRYKFTPGGFVLMTSCDLPSDDQQEHLEQRSQLGRHALSAKLHEQARDTGQADAEHT